MHHCALCSNGFASKAAYNQHLANHEEPGKTQWPCPVCSFTFSDSYALETHKAQTGHSGEKYTCDKCGSVFPTQSKFKQHTQFPSPCYADTSRTLTNPTQTYGQAGYIDLDTSTLVLRYDSSRDAPSRSPTPSDVSGVYCHDCKRTFTSMALYNRHCLSCTVQNRTAVEIGDTTARAAARPPFRSQAELGEPKMNSRAVSGQSPPVSQFIQSRPAPTAPVAPIRAARAQAPVASPSVGAPQNAVSGGFVCGINNCSRVFRSEAGLKQHKIDSHSVGGRGLDLQGRDSWMLPQSSRNQLQNLGVCRPLGPAPKPSRGNRHDVPPSIVGVARHVQAPIAARQPSRNPVHVPLPPADAPNGLPIGSPADLDQANDIHDKIMRMLITADIAIHHDGKFVYDGVEWTRISVDRQNEVASRFDELVHLKRLSKQGQARQHVTRPIAFQGESVGDYLGSEFEQLPDPWDGSVNVIVLCCSKVLLENQCEEVAKIAAVDVLTGRPLMSYLVCTSATEKVRDWRASLTGLSSFQDFEAARAQKFKILKGWTAARAALGKFVDQNTIFLGCNLRGDLDALRIRHGRCVDLIKVIEKAAENRPLSKGQLHLEALLRDLLEKRLPTDYFGRDCLQDAFAVRELALFSIKHNEKFVRYVRDKVREYGLLNPTRQ
ncbi:uncharacterized protein CC84DRAFT_1089994 [Paraphaeosphaeria sporulosa]|uniref:C2H2-type domain-containing protein n=1 Tax=Paraphaeosphaeria sporulosa TaxID=1460663 RepID=A0A177CHT5_9PLEO|nr:uncharacterized protein CC84DRAFT_1089994 [Paraphaeosphaeria sporulosa]OAG07095.1 hypothetical protein CC84DRAFT_1089994 [Paraphaeosphaeria sporulosa]